MQNARSGSDGKSPDPTPTPALKRIFEAFRSDLGPAAEELQKVLDLPEAEMRAACKDLAGRLPDLLPADPAMAAILAEELAGAFAEAVGGEAAIANETDAQGHEHAPAGSSDGGRFISKDGGSSAASATDDAKAGDAKPTPHNDGKIDFGPLAANKPIADSQARKFGYAGVDDMMAQSATVPAERVQTILKGSNAPCKPHEAVAAIRSGASIDAACGEKVKLTESLVRHYVCGERRERNGNDPKISNLADFPKAVGMIRDPSVHVSHTLHGEKIVQPDGNYPKGTQTEWTRRTPEGRLNAYAWTDSGVLNGWHIRK